MSGGQPTPPTITEPFAVNAPSCTQAAPVIGGKTFPFPTSSQIGVLAGAASLNDGYPPVTMVAISNGGTPPFGIDTNGILYILSSWIVFLAAGQLPQYNSTLSTAMNGYGLGALLGKANGSGIWLNLVAGNETDPDTGGAGWADWAPGGVDYMSATVPAGTTDNYNPSGFSPSTGFLDVNTAAGNASIGSLPLGLNGQTVTLTCTGPNTLTLLPSDGSATQPTFRTITGGITLLPNQACNVKMSTTLNQWVVIP
jgi:hypothetical protein